MIYALFIFANFHPHLCTILHLTFYLQALKIL